MKIYVSQFYTEVGASYPFTHHFQRAISAYFNDRVIPSAEYVSRYSEDFNLVFNIGAKSSLSKVDVLGPTVFKKDRTIEYTVFLPFNDRRHDPEVLIRATLAIIKAVSEVLNSLGFDTHELANGMDVFANSTMSDPKMISHQ